MAQVDKLTKRAPDIAQMVDYWDLIAALDKGVDGMRNAGARYLPMFPDEGDADYKFRLQCTKMTNILSDIFASLAAKPFEKAVRLDEGQDNPFIDEFFEDVDGAGNNITVFAGNVFLNGIKRAVDWIFIDYPKFDVGGNVSVEQKRTLRARPYWSRISADNVFEVRTQMIGAKRAITYFRYREVAQVERVRVLQLVGDQVTYEVWEKSDTFNHDAETAFVIVDSGVMAINEIPIVPFMVGDQEGNTFEFNQPMKAAADAQHDLYDQESALKYTKKLAAFPMLSGNGINPPKDEKGNPVALAVGPHRVLYAPMSGNGQVGSWRYVEPNANSLMFLAKEIQDAMRELRELGRQPLTAQTQNLTTVTTEYAAGKSRSSVSQWALRLRDALENAVRITLKWEGQEASLGVFVYTDFDSKDNTVDAEVLGVARDRGDLSQETYWEELKRRDILSDSFTPERELQRLAKEPAMQDQNLAVKVVENG